MQRSPAAAERVVVRAPDNHIIKLHQGRSGSVAEQIIYNKSLERRSHTSSLMHDEIKLLLLKHQLLAHGPGRQQGGRKQRGPVAAYLPETNILIDLCRKYYSLVTRRGMYVSSPFLSLGENLRLFDFHVCGVRERKRKREGTHIHTCA